MTGPGGVSVPFEVSGGRADALICGEDEIGATLRLEDTIDAYLAEARTARPWLYPRGGEDAA